MTKSLKKKPGGRRLSPGSISILAYALLIASGTFFLLLPVSTTRGISAVDALFTSASAVCVTGLAVVDTPSTFTLFGRTVILALIQVGGIGIMVLSTLFLLSLGRRVSMSGKSMIRDTYSYGQGQSVHSLIRHVLVFTAVIEIIGALIMFPRFYHLYPLDKAVYFSIFHAVSAFCNAGFSLYSDSFTRFASDWVLNLAICFLIIFGGIGFIVMAEIRQKFSFRKKFWTDFSLHTKLVLASTLILLAASTLTFLALEWSNTLKDLPLSTRILASFFQAVNTRTAGFNTLSIGSLANETLFISILLMFIGTAPGSCGGGIKVTTFSTIALLGFSRFSGHEHPQAFYRRISPASISKAVSLMIISVAVIIVGIILIQQVELGDVSHSLSRGAFLEMLFEMVSAFGTVGLSTGITPGLSAAGKLIITAMMFIGRLGPMAIALAVSRREKSARFSYAQENIMIG